MKFIKTLVIPIILISTLCLGTTFSTDAKNKWGHYHREIYQHMFLYFKKSNNKTIELSLCGRKICEPYNRKIYKKLTIQLDSGKKIKIENGLFYSKGKLVTGTIKTEKTRQDEHDYNWYKFKIEKGEIIKGTEYVSFLIIPEHD